ncbi:hypothetical protein [Leptolyngbya sp. KIOST-1]|uniref:hypothetical protein n=1 Tax=Leptolyngbya sp. KIOST-1 TaxID=1229172 RepID=UPI00068DD234|nr:hypothetical protein [Leptolyngbya sp. KIOST-1]
MATSPFLTTFVRHRDPRLLWPAAAVASVVAHGVALVMVRALAIQTPTLPAGETAPLPIQLVDLPPDLPAPDEAAIGTPEPAPAEPAPAEPAAPIASPRAAEAVTPPAPPRPPLAPFLPPTQPQAAPPVAPVPSAVAPAPPRPAAPAPAAPAPAPPAPAPPTPPTPPAPPAVEPPPPNPSPPSPPPPAPGPSGGQGQGGQVVPLGIRLNPSGRDIPETAPQLLGAAAIELQPLASACGFANLEALLTGIVATSVQLQIRVETSGEITQVRPLQGTGSSAVDDLVGCVIRQRLRLQPASSAGVAQLTDAFILDARIQF